MHKDLVHLDLYNDKETTDLIDRKTYKNGFKVQDTVITFDPEIFEETMSLTNYELGPEEIFIFQVFATAYFDIVNSEYYYFPKAIAVIEQNFLHPLFWIKIDFNKNLPDLNNPFYLNASRIIHSINKTNFKDTIYGNKLTPSIQKYLESLANKGSKDENKIIAKELMPTMAKGIRTEYEVGENFEEIIKKIEYEYNENIINGLSFECIWSYNNKSKNIECCPLKINFLKSIYNNEGQSIGAKSVLWQKKKYKIAESQKN